MALTRWLVAVVAALALLTGCSGDPEESSTASGSSDSSEAEEAAPAIPEDLQVVEADASGVRFGVPEGWQVTGPEALDNPGSQAELEALAAQSGIPLEQFQQMVGQVDVLAISPDGAENVNVLPLRGVGSVPEPGLIRADLERVGATVTDVVEIDTWLGTGQAVTYSLPTQRGEQHGMSLFVVADGSVVNLTGTTGSADRSAALVEQVADTLRTLD
ncbi:hypothetical protein KUV85_17145 [Nocardioides panacisoli]|uniref:hypothetical protein n=1 Tax=Nocardioides panacisoli TaxID=627624 RepID=UPI001C6385CF|nr:hypothetical protein [Nocardioides panacisoli]QYJ04025.1 hypothetical protein KUV85_17145 [Nocardioides panacisoli]